MTQLPATHFNPLDWLLVLLLAYSTVKAFLQGFFRSAFALGGLVAAFILASACYAPAAAHFRFATQPVRECISFLAILIVTMVAANLLGRGLHKTASAIGLGFLDRLGGAAFGFVRGCLLGVAFLMAFTAFIATASTFGSVTGDDWVRSSVTGKYFESAARAIAFVVPSDFQQKLRAGVDRIKHTAPHWIKSAP